MPDHDRISRILGSEAINIREAIAERDRLRVQLDRLRAIGQRMSNLMHNLSQESWTFEPRHRDEMRELYREWDVTISEHAGCVGRRAAPSGETVGAETP